MAYRKDDIPKVKLDIPNVPKFDLGDLTELMSNMDRLFDNIAKDIIERQDNVMAMEFTRCIGELLKKNGVLPKMTEYTRNFETDNTFETRYGVSIDELDFSEHDKVFEDKIADLEDEITSLKSHMLRLRERCTDDARRHFENGIYGCLTIVNRNGDLELENQQLKQRIAELESENEKLFDYLNGITGNTKAEIKNNIKNIEKIDKKPTKRTGVIIAREIDGQTYVTLEDFMSVVNDLQAEIGT